jgi:membrane-associated phospholipid phosphatase/protein tyrosine phosphatase (PTP) superfamily phosphohydrolase (DUF442 family)
MEKNLNTRRMFLFAAGILLPLFCFGWLAECVWNRNGLEWDAPALHFVHQLATPRWDSLMVAVTTTGDVRTVVTFATLAALGLVARQRRKDASLLARCIVGTALAAYVAKAALHRTRPHFWESPAPETDFGFPSGHAMDSLALAFGLAVIAWPTRWRWPVIICGSIYVSAVGASRLSLGVHYPSDVIGGWTLAVAWLFGLLLIRATAQTDTPRRKKLALLAAGIVASIIASLGAYIWSDLSHNNLRVVVPGETYRAGKMSTNALARCIETYHVKSVLNLRGESWDREWYRSEMETTKNLNVAHYDLSLSARQELTETEMAKLEQILRDAPKPVLIHCDGGADRSALASAIYLYAIAGKSAEEAERELSPWNGHLPIFWPKVMAMDNSFHRYVSNHVDRAEIHEPPGD